MAGLKFKKGAAPKQPTLDVRNMDVPKMLAKQLNIPPEAVQQLMQMLKQVKTPAEAAQIIKQFDRNPQTMNEQFDPQPMKQNPAVTAAPAPNAGLQLK